MVGHYVSTVVSKDAVINHARMRILVITPKFPLPARGACEQDRLEGIAQLRRLGHEVMVIAKVFDFQDRAAIQSWSQERGVECRLVDYEFTRRKKTAGELWYRLLHPGLLDGAAYEYATSAIQNEVRRALDEWRPDIAWFEYTFLWPLYPLARQRHVPIITRSANFEALHFLQEDGVSVKNVVKAIPKVYSEFRSARSSDVVTAITPREARWYRWLGAARVLTLPLRALPAVLGRNQEIRDREPLHVCFLGASYNVMHNKKAAAFVIRQIAPLAERKFPGLFRFHILGGKLPADLQSDCNELVRYEGFVPDLDAYLATMDIAVIPSLSGAGMQQKIFEPIARGLPTVTSARGLAGYPFRAGEHVMTARSAAEFVAQLGVLRDCSRRRTLSKAALALSTELFSRAAEDAIVERAIALCKKNG